MARIHHQGVQQSLLHQTTATPPTECTERTEPSCRERTPTDGTDGHRWLGGAVLPQNTQNWAAWVWQGCHTLLICEHPCSSVGGSSLPEGSVRAFCGNIFSSTDGTDEHRWLGCAVLPQNTQNWAAWVWQGCHTLLICEHPCSSVGGSSLPEGSVRAFCGNIFSSTDGTDEHRWLGCAVLPQNTQNWAAWVWQGCHTLLICEHPCSSVGGSSLPEGSVRSVRSVGEHRSLVGALETSAPPTE